MAVSPVPFDVHFNFSRAGVMNCEIKPGRMLIFGSSTGPACESEAPAAWYKATDHRFLPEVLQSD